MTISISPTYPIPGETVTLSASVTSAANSFEWFLTDVPESSTLAVGRLSGDTFTPDVQGEYDVAVVEYVTVGSLRRLVQEQTATIRVAELLEFPISTNTNRGLTLQLRLVLDTVRQADTTDYLNEESRQAMLPSAMQTYLAALEGKTHTTLAPTLITRANALRTAFEAHRADTVNGGTPSHPGHAVADTSNAVVSYSTASNDSAIALVNTLLAKLKGHMVAPSAASRWHSAMDDTESKFPVGDARTVSEAWVLLASLIRAYDNHRANVTVNGAAVHGSVDTANALVASLPLEDFLVALFESFDVPSRAIGYNYGGDFVTQIGAKQKNTNA